MFGYVVPAVPELKVKEHTLYRAVYCGLCHTMGKTVGSLSRLSLSYDFVFLALVRLALTGEAASFSDARCLAHPFRKRQRMDPNEALTYAARAAALLTYHKLKDDVADESFFSSLPSRLLLPAASGMRKRAALPALDGEIGKKLAALTEAEKAETASADLPASLFGELLGTVFADGLDGENARIAREIGYHTGKWIYLTDAADDREKDGKRHRYNPLNLASPPDDGTASDLPEERLNVALRMELHAASLAAELIGWQDRGIEALVKNILYLGMPEKAAQVLFPKKKAEQERKPKQE